MQKQLRLKNNLKMLYCIINSAKIITVEQRSSTWCENQKGIKMLNYKQIQDEIIEKYKIVIVDNSTCWSRTHAHCDGTRRVCKWKRANSLKSTFTLAHEVGHIMNNTSRMRRGEQEYYATVWALKKMKEYKISVDEKTINDYQRYIDRTFDRGKRRGGFFIRDVYQLKCYRPEDIHENPIVEPKEAPRRRRVKHYL